MHSADNIDLLLTLLPPGGMTVRDLGALRSDLVAYLRAELPADLATISAAPDSRSIDPAVVGAVALMVLPVALDKFGDLLIKWVEIQETRKACSVEIEGRVKGHPVKITFNDLRTMTPEDIKRLLRKLYDVT